MKIIVTGPASLIDELMMASTNAEWVIVENSQAFNGFPDADAFFNLDENSAYETYTIQQKPIFINSVTTTLQETASTGFIVRINGWPGFLCRKTWEIAGEISPGIEIILSGLEKQFITVADEPGFVSARVLSMIINEAYFAKAEGVSTEKDIDVAMRLGTNYPKGPFEWSEEIGRHNVVALLTSLSRVDQRYAPAPLLIEAARL